MSETRTLGSPSELSEARAMAHAAAQLLYRAAVANLSPLPGDEHGNLGWDSETESFKTHPLDGVDGAVELRLSPLQLTFRHATVALGGETPVAALEWLDAQLTRANLQPASGAVITYDLPDDVTGLSTFDNFEELAHFAAWFDLAANALNRLATDLSALSPGPSAVRCWPHHFDIATYVSLENGNPEEARGIGVGLSPGDGSYDEPYFYVNAWPHLDKEALPAAISPGHWHTAGFVGLIATGTEVCAAGDVQSSVDTFLRQSFEASRSLLGV